MNGTNEEAQLLSECIVIATRLAKRVAKKCQQGECRIEALARVNDALTHSVGVGTFWAKTMSRI
jgi:hypothetical protein